MDPAIAIQMGISGAKAVGRTAVGVAKTTGQFGLKVHNWLKETLPLENPLMGETAKADFKPIDIPIPEELNYKIKLIKDTAQTLEDPAAVSMIN